MSYVVQGCIDEWALRRLPRRRKEAFAKAIGWHVAERYTDVSIHDGSKSYSIHEFALVMALQEIASTLANDNDAGLLMADQGWQRKFENPILLPDGRALHSLRDASDYITALPKEQSDLAQRRVSPMARTGISFGILLQAQIVRSSSFAARCTPNNQYSGQC
jgi:hypothetical protein